MNSILEKSNPYQVYSTRVIASGTVIATGILAVTMRSRRTAELTPA